MARVLMTWNRPHHLSEDEVESWTREQVRQLAGAHGVASVALTRVTPTECSGRTWDWTCELHLSDDVDAEECLRDPVCAEWLHDLRLLGMRPAVAILAVTEPVT